MCFIGDVLCVVVLAWFVGAVLAWGSLSRLFLPLVFVLAVVSVDWL